MSTFHARECMLGECKNCGIQTLQNYPFELALKRLVIWCEITYVVVGKTSDSCDNKVSMVKYYQTKPCELIDYLKPKL
jgi:hypothetical protein